MKNLFRYSFLLIAISAVLFTGCKDDNDATVNHFDLMTDYLIDQSLDIPNVIGDKTAGTFFVTAAPATEGEITDWAGGFDAIFDIRGADDYNAGHIVGAQNVAWGSILDEATTLGKSSKILIVCYSGQSACYATSLLRIAGFSKAKALKWGMSGWNNTFADNSKGWNNAIGNSASSSNNWTTGQAPNNEVSNYPSISSGATDGYSVVMERVKAAFAAGFKGEAGTAVLENPGNYHINNYFSEAHYGSTGFGHIDGAFRIQPLTVAGDQIKYLNPDETVITYCYTGQTSAIITAYLNVLGYNAKSLKAGINSIYNEHTFWDNEDVKNQWGGDSNPKNYPTVTN